MRPKATTLAVTCLLLGLAPGCVGQITMPGAGPAAGVGTAGTGAAPVTGAAGGQGTSVPTDFTPPSDDIIILPFAVRVARVAAVAGVAPADPLLNSLRENRLSLGDYDFANNIQPDKTWTSLKVADWVRALKPICASPQMHARYPSLPESLPALIEAAHGRPATAEDTAAVTASAAGLPTSSARYDTICLATLSSLEFVAQ